MPTPAARFPATEGRQRYLRQANLDLPHLPWWQAAHPPTEALIPRGLDFLTTIEADQWIDVPTDMLGDDMEPFQQMVNFRGAPLDRAIGNADTVMERMEDARIGVPVRTRLVAFGNVSASPIELKGRGTMAGRYDLFVTLSPSQESYGEMTLHSDDGLTGTFTSKVSLAPLFELRPVDGGEPIFVDTGQISLPGFPMELASSGGHWSRRPPTMTAVTDDNGQSLYYPGKISIITEKLDPHSGPGDSFVLAACAKRQATLDGE